MTTHGPRLQSMTSSVDGREALVLYESSSAWIASTTWLEDRQ